MHSMGGVRAGVGAGGVRSICVTACGRMCSSNTMSHESVSLELCRGGGMRTMTSSWHGAEFLSLVVFPKAEGDSRYVLISVSVTGMMQL